MGRSGKKCFGIGMTHLAEDIAGGTLLDNAAILHDRDAACQPGNDRQIMRDKDETHIIFAHKFAQQIKNLRLRRYIKSGSRLISNQ